MNIIYPDGSGKFDVGTRTLQVPLGAVAELIRHGVEFFYFEAGPFHVKHDMDIEGTIIAALGIGRPKKQRTVSTKGRAPTRVSRVLITAPDGKEFEVNNLLAWMKQTFGDRYKSLYFAAVRGHACDGYRVKHLGWVTLTVIGNEDFVKKTKEK